MSLSHVIVENTSLPQPNSTYVLWVRQDQLLRSTLISSLSPQVLYLIVDCTTSRSIWLTLENALASPSTRIMTIHIALQELRQHDESVTAYLQRAKHYHDGLAAAGRPLSTALLPLYQPEKGLECNFIFGSGLANDSITPSKNLSQRKQQHADTATYGPS